MIENLVVTEPDLPSVEISLSPIQIVHQAALATLTSPDEWDALAQTFAARALYLRTHPDQ